MLSIGLKTNFELKDAREFAVRFSKVCLFLAESHLVPILSGIRRWQLSCQDQKDTLASTTHTILLSHSPEHLTLHSWSALYVSSYQFSLTKFIIDDRNGSRFLNNHSSEPNKEYSARIAAYLEKTIGVSSDRGYMYYCHPIFSISRVLIT